MTERPHNHWTDGGDLVIEEKTLFRPVGFVGQSGGFYATEDEARISERGGYSPVYEQIATWRDGVWND